MILFKNLDSVNSLRFPYLQKTIGPMYVKCTCIYSYTETIMILLVFCFAAVSKWMAPLFIFAHYKCEICKMISQASLFVLEILMCVCDIVCIWEREREREYKSTTFIVNAL